MRTNKGQSPTITREGNRAEFIANVWCGAALTVLGVAMAAFSIWQMARPQDF
jgi:hypothetical protein